MVFVDGDAGSEHVRTIAPGNTTNAQVYIQVIYMLYVMLHVTVVVVAIIVVVIYCSVGQAAQSFVARGSRGVCFAARICNLQYK